MKTPALLSLLLLLTACARPSEQQQAQDLVREYLQHELHDPASYEPGAFEVVGYSRADSAEAAYYRSSKELIKNSKSYLGSASQHEGRQAQQSFKANAAQSDVAFRELQQADTARVGWRVTHDYRAKNQFNALTKYHQTFVVYPAKKLLVALED